MGKLLGSIAAVLAALSLTGCVFGGAGKTADAFEQWVESQEDFQGVEYSREANMFGTIGATASYRARDIDDAKRFSEAVVEEVERIDGKKGAIAAKVEWPVTGGVTSMRFSGDSPVSEEWWRVADAQLPDAATHRYVGWRRKNVRPSKPDESMKQLDVVDYESPKALVTALAISEDDGWQVTLGSVPGDVLGPFRGTEMVQRAENLKRLAEKDVQYELAGDRVILQDPEHLFDAADTLGEHGWHLEQEKFKIAFGPGQDSQLELVRWMIESGHDYGLEQRVGRPFLFAKSREACLQMLDEAPLPSGHIRVGCHDGGDAIAEVDVEQARLAMPILLDAVQAGAERLTLKPDRFYIELDGDNQSTWEPALRHVRRLAWDGERAFEVRGGTAYAVPFRSTAEGEAIDAEIPDGGNANKPFRDDAEAVVEAWNASK